MNIAVIGANGRSGKAFIDVATQAGHYVRAGYHRTPVQEGAQIVAMQCDATNEDHVAALLQGTDAVVSLIGHVKGSPATVQTDAIRTIIHVMQGHGPKRIVSLTGTGVRFPGDKVTPLDRLLNTSITLIDKPRISDGQTHAALLQDSGLDWTLIRVLKLTNMSAAPFVLTAHGPTKWYVSRVDVARAIVQVLEQQSFIGEAPILSPFS